VLIEECLGGYVRIAVVHDYFTQMGGAEKVAEELIRMLPGADLHATVALPELMPQSLVGRQVGTTWMQHMPLMKQYYRLYFMLYPLAVRSLDLSGYDLVISSSSGYVKGVRTDRDAIHVCYCHTPMRWAWSFDSYSAREKMSTAKRLLLPPMIGALREWDKAASCSPDHFVANSKTVAARIERAYGRTAEVIHPPIDVERFRPSDEQEDYYLVLARLIPYKRLDLAIEACTTLGRRLMVIGDGPDRAQLMAKAGPTVTFLNRLSDAEVEHYAARCRALIFPGEEDFGMAPLEIAAAGRPTIAYRAGGAVETIIDGVTGVFFDRQDASSLAEAIQRFERQEWSAQALRSHAEGFGIDVFQSRFRQFLAKVGAPVPEYTSVPFVTPAFGPRLAGISDGVLA
jgi:glycosyltransferase involved in cell wall biosynthesis